MKNLLTRNVVVEAAKDGSKPEGFLRKAVIADDVKSVEGESRSVRFTISTSSPDRDNDTVAASGWKLENYKKNPVVLWAHDYSSLPVGKATRIMVDGNKLVADMEFAAHPFAETVMQMVKGGFLRATSVGFAPHLYKFNEARGGLDFEEQELLEFSIVPVPANPEALIEARAAGIDTEPLKQWAEAVVKGLKTITPEERKSQAETVANLESAAKLLTEASPETKAEEPVVAATDEKACTACGKAAGDTYVVRGAVTLCSDCWKAVTPPVPAKSEKKDDLPHSGGDSGMGTCAFHDPGDGTDCSHAATESCTNCGAAMCGEHIHPSGVCMLCGAKAEAASPETQVLSIEDDNNVLDISDDPAPGVDISTEELRSVLAGVVSEHMGQIEQVVRQETAAAINRARGRVD